MIHAIKDNDSHRMIKTQKDCVGYAQHLTGTNSKQPNDMYKAVDAQGGKPTESLNPIPPQTPNPAPHT